MSVVSSWVLSLVGVVIITAIVEIILPESNIGKYVKGILALFTIFIMVSPVTSVNIADLFNDEEYEALIDDDFLTGVNVERVNFYKTQIIEKLNKNGIDKVVINIDWETNNGVLKINNIFVNLCDMVINNNDKNIDIYNNIKNIIISVVDVKVEDIVFDGR